MLIYLVQNKLKNKDSIPTMSNKQIKSLTDQEKVDSTLKYWEYIFKLVPSQTISNIMMVYEGIKTTQQLEPKLQTKVYKGIREIIKNKKHCLDNDVCCTGKCLSKKSK